MAQVEPGVAGGQNSAVTDQGDHCKEAVLATGEGLTRQVCCVAVPVHTQGNTGH